jgi:hypothetical protein
MRGAELQLIRDLAERLVEAGTQLAADGREVDPDWDDQVVETLRRAEPYLQAAEPGDRVRHPMFGNGTVLRRKTEDDELIAVRFDRGSTFHVRRTRVGPEVRDD